MIRGTADQVGTWPTDVDAQPANLRVKRLSKSGKGRVVEDHSDDIKEMLKDYNQSLDVPARAAVAATTAGRPAAAGDAAQRAERAPHAGACFGPSVCWRPCSSGADVA